MQLIHISTIVLAILMLLSVIGVAFLHFHNAQKGIKVSQANGHTWYDYEDYMSDHQLKSIVAWCWMIIMGLLTIILWCCLIGTTVQNRIAEPALYASTQSTYVTVTQALDVSDDVIKSDLYLSAVDYNKTVAKYQSYYNQPGFAINFSGKYDWNALPVIDLTEYGERP